MSEERARLTRRLTPEACERIRWRANQMMLRGVQFLRDDPDDPTECPLLTLTAWSAVRMPGACLPWKQARGNA
jgi:hypothetical protein